MPPYITIETISTQAAKKILARKNLHKSPFYWDHLEYSSYPPDTTPAKPPILDQPYLIPIFIRDSEHRLSVEDLLFLYDPAERDYNKQSMLSEIDRDPDEADFHYIEFNLESWIENDNKFIPKFTEKNTANKENPRQHSGKVANSQSARLQILLSLLKLKLDLLFSLNHYKLPLNAITSLYVKWRDYFTDETNMIQNLFPLLRQPTQGHFLNSIDIFLTLTNDEKKFFIHNSYSLKEIALPLLLPAELRSTVIQMAITFSLSHQNSRKLFDLVNELLHRAIYQKNELNLLLKQKIEELRIEDSENIAEDKNLKKNFTEKKFSKKKKSQVEYFLNKLRNECYPELALLESQRTIILESLKQGVRLNLPSWYESEQMHLDLSFGSIQELKKALQNLQQNLVKLSDKDKG